MFLMALYVGKKHISPAANLAYLAHTPLGQFIMGAKLFTGTHLMQIKNSSRKKKKKKKKKKEKHLGYIKFYRFHGNP